VAVNITSQKKDANRLHKFLSFCEGLGILAYNALLASEDILMAWVLSYAGRIAGKTISAKISAIKKGHERHGLHWCRGDHLCRIITGVEELRRIRAICLLSFFCQLRSGKILPPTRDIRKFNPLCHATFTNIAQSTAKNGACNLHLPWSKTQKAQGDDIWIPREEAPLDPIHAIHKHFIKNNLNLDHPIATYCDTQSILVMLTQSKFVHRINEILGNTKKGHPCISGHCF
jgi:hypothetical protein